MSQTHVESAPTPVNDGHQRRPGRLSDARRYLSEARWIPPVLALGFLVALTIGLFRHQLFDQWTFPWDFIGTYSTTPAFVADTIGHLHPMAWSPFVASGFPVSVNPQAGLYFPVWWLFGLVHAPLVMSAVTDVQIAHILLGSVGALLLARARRLAWPWATAVAVAYLLFGGFYGQAEHADYVRGFAYLPWLLWSLTAPASGGSWRRLFAVPTIMWLIATGAYPGQLVSLTICGVAYFLVELYRMEPAERRRYRTALVLAAAASAAVSLAVLLPYLLADHNHELVRVVPPSAPVRSAGALAPIDLLGSYLSTFGLHQDGTITSWAVAVPILVGLGFLTTAGVRRQLPIVVSGAVALALAMTPKIGIVGKAMVALGPLFTSRFPAADYKAGVAIAVIVLSAEGWSRLPRRHFDLRVLRGAAMAALILVGALLVSSPYAQATRAMWLLEAVLAATVVLSIIRPRPAILAILVIALIAVDGIREDYDYRSQGITSSWNVAPSATGNFIARDQLIRTLTTRLWVHPQRRSARAPQSPIAYPDAGGWIVDAYHVSDYGGTLERALYDAEQDPALRALLADPWDAFVFPCRGGRCPTSAAGLPPPKTWNVNPAVRTLSYSTRGIRYAVHLAQPSVMVENELALPGWRSSDKRAQLVPSSFPFRIWHLAAGDYQFVANYHQPGQLPQDLVAVLAVLLWGAFAWSLLRGRSRRRRQPFRAAISARKSSYSRM